MARQIIYGNVKLPLAGDMTLDQAKTWAAAVEPGIADADGYEDENGNYVFTKRAGRKG